MEVKDLDELADTMADKVVPKLHERGPVIGDHVILSRRQAMALATGAAGVGLLSAIGVENASAEESLDQLGSPDVRLDIWAKRINDGGVIADGDGTERNIWVIGSEDDDPADATDVDLIFEEE